MKKIVCIALAAILCLSVLSACQGGQAQEPVDLSAFAQTLLEAHEWGPFLQESDPENETDKTFLDQGLPGLLDLDLEQRVLYMCNITMNNGEFYLVQAKNAEDAAKVEEIFQARVDYMVEGGAFYPGPTELWTNSSQVVAHGDYVMMVCHEECDAIVSQFDALFDQA